MSWIEYSAESEFPIENLPYGVFYLKTEEPSKARVGVAIGDYVVDLHVLQEAGLFDEAKLPENCFTKGSLNDFMALGRPTWVKVRSVLTKVLSKNDTSLKDNNVLKQLALAKMSEIVNLIPAQIGDYTDFYSSKEHATNLGKMFRPDEEPLKPNWVWIPVGYHGRASSVVVSGHPCRRPWGQVKPPNAPTPIFKKCARLDFELELGTFIGPGNKIGDPVKIENAEEHIFGVVLMNDWSARDIQAWEYIPLGPFTGKNLLTSISPWIVTLEALAPFRVEGPKQDPDPLPYLKNKGPAGFDINLEVYLKTQKQTEPLKISGTNYKYMYWSMAQQVVQHTVTGCNLQPGDLFGSGTISGPTKNELGSLIEISHNAQNPVQLASGENRSFLEDGDTLILKGWCQGNGYRIGFGECSGEVIPAHN